MMAFIRVIPLIVTFLVAATDAQSTQLLFSLSRSTNINKVYYEARITKEGLLDSKEPVHAYWILWAKDSSGALREELSRVEKNMAYGFKIKKNEGRRCSLTIVSYADRVIDVSLSEGKAVARTVIDKNVSYLDSIFISFRESRMFPKVNYIELFGRAVSDGAPQHEKIKPK